MPLAELPPSANPPTELPHKYRSTHAGGTIRRTAGSDGTSAGQLPRCSGVRPGRAVVHGTLQIDPGAPLFTGRRIAKLERAPALPPARKLEMRPCRNPRPLIR